MSPIDDRRVEDRGAPPGVPDRRRLKPTFENRLTLGNLIQTAAMVLSVLSGAAAAVFTAGGYVQKLRDDMLAADRAVAREAALSQAADHAAAQDAAVANAKIIELLQRLADHPPPPRSP